MVCFFELLRTDRHGLTEDFISFGHGGDVASVVDERLSKPDCG